MDEAQVACFRLAPADLNQVLAFRQQFQMDFDDAYQYAAAEKYDLIIITFDKGFERTKRGRKTPAEIIGDSA